MKPSALNPPKGRALRFLLPAASVRIHGAQKQGGVAHPALYPNRHIFVDPGHKGAFKDGTRQHPYSDLGKVLEDAGLRAVCSILAEDAIHLHLRSASFKFDNPPEAISLFSGGGFDFRGRLVIENWPGERCSIKARVKTWTALKPLEGQAEAFRKAKEEGKLHEFYAARHKPVSGVPAVVSLRVFHGIRGVLFHGIDIDVKHTHEVTGADSDQWGNNSPYALAGSSTLTAWDSCDGSGFHQCAAKLSSAIDAQPPDPLDIFGVDEEEDEDGKPGAGGGIGGGGLGSILPPYVVPPDGNGGHGTIDPGGGTHPEIPPDHMSLGPAGAHRVTITVVRDSARTRSAENSFSTELDARTVFGCVATLSCYGKSPSRWSRDEKFSSRGRASDREYVHTFRTVKEGEDSHEQHASLSKGAAASVFAYGDVGSHVSTIIRTDMEVDARAGASRSKKVETSSPFGGTHAVAVCVKDCGDMLAKSLGAAYSADASSSWKDLVERAARQE